MHEKKLHIISFDVPLPADYGGAIDVFYRIKALHELGVKITLHCYEYGRGESKELENYVEHVIYYPRRKRLMDVFDKMPFIVKTRASRVLMRNLLMDDSPILFEGLHTTFMLNDERLRNRIRMVRTHNIEHEYYEGLAKLASGFRKKFYSSEAKKLKVYEPRLRYATHIFAIKEDDAFYFKQYCKNTFVLPACASTDIGAIGDTEPWCLFQGNLSVPENEQGLLWLIEEVFQPYNLTNKLKVAGKRPTDRIISACNTADIELIADPDEEEMHELLHTARVHVFYSEQDTGVKLKLVNALRTTGAILANNKMLRGTDFENMCDETNTPESYASRIESYMVTPMSEIHLEIRRAFIEEYLNPTKNCEQIVQLL
jgi:hypothetical protein